VSKFVGKFRKNQDYREDYEYSPKQRKKEAREEIKKLRNSKYQDFANEYMEKVQFPRKNKHY